MESSVGDWVDYDDQAGEASDDDFFDDRRPVDPDLVDFLTSIGGPDTSNPIPVVRSPKAVHKEARERSRGVASSYRALRDIVERHEATIHRRWGNKTKQQKLRVLLAAWPNMAAVHRPDFHAFRKETPAERDAGSRFRDSYMWPYINQEDLSKPRPLLMLINARGRNPPPDFAAADFEAMRLGRISKGVVVIYLNTYTMILNGVTEANNYGKLLSWADHADAFQLMASRKQFIPGVGLLILEAQERLLAFLVQCCRLILHDIPADALTSDAYPVQPEPQLKPETEERGFDSLAVMAASAPYRLPAKLDLDRIESLLAARVAAAEDHLWALREDPGYFAEEVLDFREHRQELLKDTQDAQHPVFRMGRENLFWRRILGNILFDAHRNLEVFSELHQLSRRLIALSAKYRGKISPARDLPEEYLHAILDFRYALDQMSKAPLRQLNDIVIPSPPMRRFFVRMPPPEGELNKIAMRGRPNVRMSPVESYATWLLRLLWEDEKLVFTGLPLAVDELERLVQTEPQARELLSARVASTIADLSIMSQCMAQLELYQPWAASYDYALAGWEEIVKRDFEARQEPRIRIRSAVSENYLGNAVLLGVPTDGRFAYPVKKRRTRENVAALRRAESDLDAFWACVDKLIHSRAGTLEGTATRRLLSQPRELQRTPEWVEPARGEDAKEAPAGHEALVKPFSELFFGFEPKSEPPAAPKIKIKTRGTPRQGTNDTNGTNDVATSVRGANEHDPQPIFPVDTRALKVFRTLFFNPDVTSTPGTVPWGDFLHAMTSTGFAAEKLYGSVWQFKPTKLDVERGIQFHEPHPSGKLPFTAARRYGRRLNRAYGWFGGMFVLKEKSG